MVVNMNKIFTVKCIVNNDFGHKEFLMKNWTTTLNKLFKQIIIITIYYYVLYIWPRGSVVVKALYYKPEGRGFDTRWGDFLNLLNPYSRTRPWGLLGL
jgi:hypothetical protein